MCETEPYVKEFSDVVTLVNFSEVSEKEWTQYIGRENSYYDLPQSIFANPYTLEEYERETAVRLYELWLFRNLFCDDEFYEAFRELEGEQLACWCLPESCHGEVLCSALVAEVNGELESHIRSRFSALEVNLFGHTEVKEETQGVLEDAGVVSE